MASIAPCITAENIEDYREAIERLKPFAERVHIDLSDGDFAPRELIDHELLFWPEDWLVDVHVMANSPRDYLQKLVALKPHTIILHAEATDDLLPLMHYMQENGVRAGIALLKSTVPSTIKPLIESADYVMIFSGDLGHYGGKANMMQVEKIKLVRAIKPDVEIGWDGGVSVDNAFSLAHGGVDVLNSGGAIGNADDPEAVYTALVGEINKQPTVF